MAPTYPGRFQKYEFRPKSKRLTLTEKMYMVSKVILLRYSDGKLIFNVDEGRHGISKNKSLKEAIYVTADMLTKFKFQGSNELFQYNVRERLVQVMDEILLTNDDCVPK